MTVQKEYVVICNSEAEAKILFQEFYSLIRSGKFETKASGVNKLIVVDNDAYKFIGRNASSNYVRGRRNVEILSDFAFRDIMRVYKEKLGDAKC